MNAPVRIRPAYAVSDYDTQADQSGEWLATTGQDADVEAYYRLVDAPAMDERHTCGTVEERHLLGVRVTDKGTAHYDREWIAASYGAEFIERME